LGALGVRFTALVACAALLGGPAFAAEVPVVSVARGSSSGLTRPMRTVVRTSARWTALWKQHAGTAEPPAPRPEVDFLREAILAVALGERPTAGWAVEITRIERIGTTTVVHVRESQPAPDALTAQVITQPYHFVRLSRPRGPVRFADEAVAPPPVH
jgi:hypothetical protein